jgi:gluconolactonase
MNRFVPPVILVACAGLAYACGTSSNASPKGSVTAPSEPPVAEGDDAGGAPEGDAGALAGDGATTPDGVQTDDPSGSPLLLGAPRTVRSFAAGTAGEGIFVDGPQWSATRQALFVSLPLELTTLGGGGKGVLTTFKTDGTNYLEVRAGDATTTGVIGSTVDKDGNLVSAELRVITRTPVAASGPLGAPTVIATGTSTGAEAAVVPFNGPNDLVVRSDGTIYVTDPGYNMAPRPQNGYLYRIAPNAPFATVADTYADNPSPNGIALAKDEKALFVSFTAPAAGTLPFVRKYVLAADGSLGNSGKFCELPDGSEPDGIALDDAGNLLVAMKTGIAIFKATGEPYGGAAAVPQVKLPMQATNVTFGGEGRKSVFVTTASGKVLELKTKVPGLVQ